MAPPRTPTRDRSPQRIITEVTAVSNSVQPSPVGPRRSSSEGLSRRSSWNRTAPDPLTFETSSNFGRTDPDIGHFDTQSIVDEPEINYTSIYTHNPSRSVGSIDLPADYSIDVDDSTRLTSAAAPHWRGETESVEQDDADQSAAWGTAGPSTPRRTSATSPMRSATLKAVSKHIRRVSLRVVNLASVQLEDKPVPRTPDREREDTGGLTPDKEIGATTPEPVVAPEDELDRTHHMTLRGRTLGVFGPDSRLRQAMRSALLWTWTEPIILALIFANAVFLTTQAWRSVYVFGRIDGYFKTWEDYALFILFCIFTVEMIARIIVSGFVLDPEIKPSSVLDWLRDLAPGDNFASRARSVRRKVFEQRTPYARTAPNSTTALNDKGTGQKATLSLALVSQVNLVAAHGSRSQPEVRHPGTPGPQYPPQPHTQHVQSSSGTWYLQHATDTPFQLAVARQRILAEQSSTYLRHSWNRTDFVAVCAFWIMFGLAVSGKETQPNAHIYVFRALSVLRTARLLAVTKGTSTIMHSLKRAGPLLARVTLFVLFAIILFSIVGVQSFKGSFRRTCVIADTTADIANGIDLSQSCGGWMNPATLKTVGYVDSTGNITSEAKGFTCPLGQICVEASVNPQNGTQAFDNIFLASMQVIIVASANTWSPVMYQMMDTDFYVSFAFFIVCIVVLNFWLINLFVAVITNMFGVIRVETKKSAFGATTLEEDEKEEQKKGWRRKAPSVLRVWYEWPPVHYFWVALVLLSFGLQASKTARSSPEYLAKLDLAEFVLTMAFDVDIVWRAIGYLPHWREFFSKKNNNLDLTLAIASTIIQIPVIKRSDVYPWLTIFQLARFYRVILVMPRMRPLLLRVFGNMTGLANMVLFLLLTNYIAALVAVQLLRGDLPEDTDMNYAQISLSFLGMYQIFSSENWTTILYNAVASQVRYQQAVIVAIFLCGWFLFANFILLQMFIAVIRENFEVAEDLKRQEQDVAYQRRIQPRVARLEWMERWNPYRFVGSEADEVTTERDGTISRSKSMLQRVRRSRTHARKASYVSDEDAPKGAIATLRKFFDPAPSIQDVPLVPLRPRRRPTYGGEETLELERHLEILSATNPDQIPDDLKFAREQRARRAAFIRAHPTFDKPFWILSQENPVRRFCQTLVTPANGERIFGQPTSPVREAFFQLVIMLVVIGGICVAAVATPVYRRNYFAAKGRLHLAWFDIAEATFGLVLVLEFAIKIIADGFALTPNAYILSTWNVIDLLILGALLANVVTSIVVIGGISRLTRSLKAFRALRLITLIGRVRETFHSVLFAGAGLILEAALLAMLYMLPYACWGLNIFAKRFYICNDGDVTGKADCAGEYLSTPVDKSLGFLAPRSWDTPSPSTTFSFDTFGSSLLILFEIVSLEGWIDVLVVALGLKDVDQQPGHNVNQVNAIFFVVYNLMGAVVILTLFVSIIIGNFSTRSGMALLTNEQRQWIDLQKLIKRQRPAKRPKTRPHGVFREWCYDRAVRKHGFWSRFMTVFYVCHILVLMSQTFSSSLFTDFLRNSVFLFMALVYALDVIIRLSGLGWRSFKANGWNLFDIVVVTGNLATGIPIVFGSTGFAIEQLQKLFLVSIAFKLVQKSDNLNQLFKTSVSSLPAIFNLFIFWLTLFVFFAIVFVEVFALTRWDTAENHNQNYSSFGNALLMLAFMSTGEGWNQYMHDFTVEYPRCQNSSPEEPDSDCGSTAWAYFLFIAWNILSMYIFVNMFTGVVVENFSYVFQLSGEMSITREEMRGFKKVWGEFDPDRTGYIPRSKLVAFFSKLRGVFEVRLYTEELSPRGLVQATKMNHPLIYRSTITGEEIPVPLNMRRLNAILNGVDYAQVRERRQTYNRLVHEARIVAEEPRGISFTNMLLLLAHHKLINDDEALTVVEGHRRKITTKHVTELMNLDRVRSTLKMVYHRRNYLQIREKLEAERRVRSGVPAIIVEDLPSSPPPSTRDIAGSNLNSPRSSFESRWSRDDATDHVWHANAQATSTPAAGTGHHRQRSDASMLSADITTSPIASPRASQDRSNRSSQVRFSQDLSVSVSRRPSIWGDIIQAAGETRHDELGKLDDTHE